MSFNECFRHSGISPPWIDSNVLFREGNPVAVPSITRLHAGLVRKGIGEREEVCVLTPTAKAEHLDLLATEVILSMGTSDRDIVFVASADTQVRSAFRGLSFPSTSTGYDTLCQGDAPIANVTAEGKLSRVTGDGSTHPKFLFSYTSKRIPNDIVGERVACVLFDDSVKVTDERLDRVRDWRSRNGIPSIVFITSDPLGDLYRTVCDDSLLWTWSTELLGAAVESDIRRGRSLAALEADYDNPMEGDRIGSQISNRVKGTKHEVNVPGGDRIEDLFRDVQETRYQFEGLVRKIDAEPLWSARRSLRYAIRDFEELLAPLDLMEMHSNRRSISARLRQLERHASAIGADPDASPAVGTYRDVVAALNNLHENWGDIPDAEKKEGQLMTHLMSIADEGDRVAVVCPSGSAAQAVATQLQSAYGGLYDRLDEDLRIHDADSIRRADPVDHVILYGAPRYSHRDLLRLTTAPHLVVLAYPSELRLLESQYSSMNEAFQGAEESDGWHLAQLITEHVFGAAVEPTPEQLDVEVPSPEEREKSELVSDVDIPERDGEVDLADIVRTFDPDYQSPEEAPNEEAETTSTVPDAQSQETGIVLRTTQGQAVYHRPDDEVNVFRSDVRKVIEKRAEDVAPGDTVLHLEDTETMREKLYSLIRDRGDAKLAYYASSWRVFLERAIQETGDDLDDFIRRVEGQLEESEYKVRQTYRNWYNLEVTRTRSKDSMRAIAEAYDLTFVRENLNTVWNAVHEMENLYQQLREALFNHAIRVATTGNYEDDVVSEAPMIRLSDFDIDQHLHRLKIDSVRVVEDVPTYKFGSFEE